MVTPFGKALRKLRVDRDWLLRDMAVGIGVSTSFLSAVETGKKPIPNDMVQKIVDWGRLNVEIARDLRRAADRSIAEVRVDTRHASEADRQAMAVLARTFGDIDEVKRKQLRDLLMKWSD